MPQLSDVSPKQWAGMMASTSVMTYETLSNLAPGVSVQLGKDIVEHNQSVLDNMVKAGWIVREGDIVQITQEGVNHLRSF